MRDLVKFVKVLIFLAMFGSSAFGEDLWKFLEYMETECVKGDTNMCYELGKIYAECNRGDANSCYELGNTYAAAKDEIDKSQAIFFYNKSCDNGSYEGCFSLSYDYGEGEGVSQDMAKARDYETKAAANLYKSCHKGNVDDCFRALNYYSRGGRYNGEKIIDVSKALGVFAKIESISSKECDEGNHFRCGLLANYYKDGDSVLPQLKNESKAKAYRAKQVAILTNECRNGDDLSCSMLSDIHSQ